PSTGQDILKGRRTEIDFLNGLVADKGDEAGLPAPTHRAIVQVVKEVERGEVQPSPALVDRVWELSGVQPLAVAQPARYAAGFATVGMRLASIALMKASPSPLSSRAKRPLGFARGMASRAQPRDLMLHCTGARDPSSLARSLPSG